MSATRTSRILLAVLSLLGLALLVGCGSSGKSATGTDASATTTTQTGICQSVAAPTPRGPQHLRAPSMALDPSKTWTARVTTNCGAFTIKLDVAHSPKTAASFAYLAKQGFYDELTFHRIVPGFVIQGGDPQGDGTGGPGYSVVEAPPKHLHYTHGIVAMAKTATDPDGASGSQFFVVTAPDAGLPPQYALLGKVVEGLGVVDAIGALPLAQSGSDGPPAQPVVIQSVVVASR